MCSRLRKRAIVTVEVSDGPKVAARSFGQGCGSAHLANRVAELGRYLHLIAQGDRSALGALYDATSPKLLGVVFRILSDRSESEDVLQEVYLTVWRQAGRFDPERASAMTWLSTIARNRAIDRLRERSRIPQTETIDAAERAPCAAPSPYTALESSDDWRCVERGLQALDQRSAWIIRTAFLEGATYEALALRIGAPLGTVKSLARRGLRKLRASFSETEGCVPERRHRPSAALERRSRQQLQRAEG